MRTSIRRRLIDSVPAVQVGDPLDYATSRVFETHMAGPETQMPYIVVAELDVDRQDASPVRAVRLEITPLVARETFRLLDTITDQVSEAFDWRVFEHGGSPLLSEVLPSERDAFFTDWDALAKPMIVDVFDLAMFVTETEQPDPVAALRVWVEEHFVDENDDPIVQTNPLTWTPSDERPGVLFRLQGIPQMIETYTNVSWLQAMIRVHVIAPGRAVRLLWTKRITEALARQRQFLMGDGSPFALEGTLSANSEAHAVRQGQITLQGRYGVLLPPSDAELLQTVNLTGDATP